MTNTHAPRIVPATPPPSDPTSQLNPTSLPFECLSARLVTSHDLLTSKYCEMRELKDGFESLSLICMDWNHALCRHYHFILRLHSCSDPGEQRCPCQSGYGLQQQAPAGC